MPNPTVNTPVLAQNSINAIKEPFCKMQDPTTITVASTLLPLFDPSGITDRELLKLCQEYGGNSRAWKRKFEELLPEVLKRHLYKGRKFTSIYEFAAKLCGLSKDSVDNVIRVYGQLEDKPILRSLVVEFGWSKLRIVSGIATPETDASWAEKVRVLPSSSLATFVRDLKRQEEAKRLGDGAQIAQNSQQVNQELSLAGHRNFVETPAKNDNTIIDPVASIEQDKLTDQQSLSHHQFPIRPIFRAENLQSSEKSGQTNVRLPVQFGRPNLMVTIGDHHENPWSTIPFKLSPETDFRLRKLKSRIEKGKKEKISFNQLFETMLDIIENKEIIVKKSRNPYGVAPLKLRRA